MEGSDICFEVVRRAIAGFIYSEAVAWYGIPYLTLTNTHIATHTDTCCSIIAILIKMFSNSKIDDNEWVSECARVFAISALFIYTTKLRWQIFEGFVLCLTFWCRGYGIFFQFSLAYPTTKLTINILGKKHIYQNFNYNRLWFSVHKEMIKLTDFTICFVYQINTASDRGPI